jgi:hypothetical protein
MIRLFVTGLALSATLFLNPGSSRADSPTCGAYFNDENQTVTLRGTIVMTAQSPVEEGGDVPVKDLTFKGWIPSFAIVLDDALCRGAEGTTKRSDFIDLDSFNPNVGKPSVPPHFRKWVGHYVCVTGKMSGEEYGARDSLPYALNVDFIQDFEGDQCSKKRYMP